MSLAVVEDLHRDGPNWKCRCPAHQDRKASLAIKIAEDQRLLLHCHAGCATVDILKQWGVSWDVLFPDQPLPNGANPRDPEKTWDYLDEQGNLLFQVRRYAGKKFSQGHLDDRGEWVPNVRHVRRVLYRLPELVKAAADTMVFVVEGEKDADALVAQGLVATTSPMGAGKWRDDYSRQLAGRRVVVIPDNDDPGREHAEKVCQSLAGIAKEVRLLHLKAVPEKGDVSDWLAQAEHPELAAAQLLDLAVSIPPFPLGEPRNRKGETAPRLILVHARDFLAEENVEPPDLVEGLLPEAGLSIVGAKPKVGKSTLIRCLCAAVVKGIDFLGRPVRQGPVIYLALEEKRTEVINHFRSLGIHPENDVMVHFGAVPEDALEALIESIKEHHPVLACIDPLFRFISIRDGNDYAQVVRALAPVVEAARATGCHLNLTHHNAKMEREGGDELLGSTGIFAAVDTAILMRRRGDQTRYAYSIQRYGKDMEPTVLQMTADGWIVAASNLEAYENAKAAEKILELLAAEPDPLPELEITERIEMRKARVIGGLRELFDQGRISRWGTGRRGDPYKFGIPWHRQGEAEKKEE